MDRSRQAVLFRISFIPALLVASLVFFITPVFTEMYQGFGADLPASSQFLLSAYGAIALTPFGFLIAWFTLRQRTDRGEATLILSGLVTAFWVFAAYGPLMAVG